MNVMNVPPAVHNGAQAQTSRYVYLERGGELRWTEPLRPPSVPLQVVGCEAFPG